MTGSIETPKNRATAQNAARIRTSTKLSHPILLVFCKCVKLHIQLEGKIMASEDSISSSRKSAADGRGDNPAPAQRRGRSFPDNASAAQEGEQGRRARKDHSLQSRPAACAADAAFPEYPSTSNTAKLYSELSTSRFNASSGLHLDSMTRGLRDNRLIGAPC
ncbi:hypothetical protein [Agrobacterium fabrum]|uniref:hypothetical protein n=1 Tax=Agrobacterium fabrum TaxID=1176649 RepID=UPI003B9DE7ED